MAIKGLGIGIAESGIASVLNRYSLRVPLNQRSYAWTETHVRTLLQDISAAIADENKIYFLGTIVLTHSGDGKLEVADGQQRLATTAILISAIRDYLFKGSENEKAAAEKFTSNYLLEFDERSGEHIPKLRLNSEDNDFFVKASLLAPNRKERSETKPKTESHERLAHAIKICAAHVETVVKPYSKSDQSKRLYDWIQFLRESAVIIEIKVPDHFNAYTLFETLNDRGLRASQADILKNYLFGKAQDRISEVAPKWAAMTSIIESIDADDLLLTYLRHYWISYNGPTIEKELAEKIREKIAGRQQAIDMATTLANDAIDYSALFTPLEHGGWPGLSKKSRAYIYLMTRILQIVQVRPLLLAIIRKFAPKEAEKALKQLLSWSVRFLIAGGGGGGVLDRHYGLRAKEITDGLVSTDKDISARMKDIVRTDSEFFEAFQTHRVSKERLARYYLRCIELARQGDAEADLGGILEDTVRYNLEHIMPLTPSEEWNLPDDIIRSFSKRLGNMTLIDPDSNVVAGNLSFDHKRVLYAKSPLLITNELEAYDEWEPVQIEDRQSDMARHAVAIWRH